MEKFNFMHPKDQIVDILGRVYRYGMTTTSGGNLSIMDSQNNMWISPAGIDKGSLRREDIVCVKADGTIEGIHRPSSEFPFHRDIYKRYQSARAILHAHPPTLVSFSVAGKIPNTTVLPTAKKICGNVGFAPYEVPGSDALGRNVSKAFAEGHSAILLENHGSCCAGATLLEAFQRFETLDFCGRLILKAQKLGTPHYLTEAELADAAEDRNKTFGRFTPEFRTSEALEQRHQMALMVQRAYRQGLFTSTEGAVAVRLEKNTFLVTPSGIDRGTIQPEDMVLVRNGNIEEGKIPSRNTWFIQQVFDAQPELNALFFANPPNLMGYAVSHAIFDPRVIPESYILLREMPTFTYNDYYHNTSKVANGISPRYPVIVIENESILSSGANLLQAFDRMEVAEYSAKATISARELGGMTPINDAQIADLVKAFNLIP